MQIILANFGEIGPYRGPKPMEEPFNETNIFRRTYKVSCHHSSPTKAVKYFTEIIQSTIVQSKGDGEDRQTDSKAASAGTL